METRLVFVAVLVVVVAAVIDSLSWRYSTPLTGVHPEADRWDELNARFKPEEGREALALLPAMLLFSAIWSLILWWSLTPPLVPDAGVTHVISFNPWLALVGGGLLGVTCSAHLGALPYLHWYYREEGRDWLLYRELRRGQRLGAAGVNLQRIAVNVAFFVALLCLWFPYSSTATFGPRGLHIRHWSLTQLLPGSTPIQSIERHEKLEDNSEPKQHYRVTFRDGRVWSTSDLAVGMFTAWEVTPEGLQPTSQHRFIEALSQQSGVPVTSGKDPAPRWGNLTRD